MKRPWTERQMVAAILAGVLALAGLIWYFNAPMGKYTPWSAAQVYRRHQEAFETVGAYLLSEDGQNVWYIDYDWEENKEFPEPVAAALRTYFRLPGPRMRTMRHIKKAGDAEGQGVVLFCIYYAYEKGVDGEGGDVQWYQYLCYAPDEPVPQEVLDGGRRMMHLDQIDEWPWYAYFWKVQALDPAVPGWYLITDAQL